MANWPLARHRSKLKCRHYSIGWLITNFHKFRTIITINAGITSGKEFHAFPADFSAFPNKHSILCMHAMESREICAFVRADVWCYVSHINMAYILSSSKQNPELYQAFSKQAVIFSQTQNKTHPYQQFVAWHSLTTLSVFWWGRGC